MNARIEKDDRGRKIIEEPCDAPCPIERGMQILGGKWTGSILWQLKDGPVRFNDLARMLPGASRKMIAARLREMEARGLVERNEIDTTPVGVAYTITPFGLTAVNCLTHLREWSESLPNNFK